MIKNVKPEICIPDGVIDGFCYPFLKSLLKKLKELQTEDRTFREGIGKARFNQEEGRGSILTPIAYSVLNRICEQINCASMDSSPDPSEIAKMIKLAEEFLAIFEVKK